MTPELIADLTHFPRFWYLDIPAWWFRFLKRLVIVIDNQLATSLMFRFWLVPIWQDTTIIGRSLSFIFRTVRVVVGGLVIVTATIAMCFWLVVWLLLPALMLIYLPLSITLFILIWIIDAAAQVIARQNDPIQVIRGAALADVGRLVELLLQNQSLVNLLVLIEEEAIPKEPISSGMEEIFAAAEEEKKNAGDDRLKPEHLFLAILGKLKFHHAEAQQAYAWVKKKKKWARTPWIWQDDYPVRPIGGVNRAWTGIITPQLDKVSTDLTQLAAKGKIPELIGRKELIEESVRILGREGRENIIVVGEAGSGKSTLVGGLANEIIRGTQYAGLRFKRLVDLDIAALTSGSMGKLKERLVTIIDEILLAGNIILFIDEIHNIIAAEEGQGGSIVFAALEPHLDTGDFQFIATTTPSDFKRFIEPSAAFARTFRVINLPDASPQEAQKILEWKAFELEISHNVTITHAAVRQAVELSRRYIHDRVLPDSAIDLLEETANKATTQDRKVGVRQIEEMVTEKTKIPVRAAESEKEKAVLLNLEKALHKRVVGQDEAIVNLADALRLARTGFAEEGRLLASFLFAGATGVGKTETAKALAQVYFGSEKAMVRLDMSEFQTEDSINRLIGPPPGKPGHELGGQLTEAVRRRPFTVILLDEIEKANPEIMDVFLQLLDDARLTDGMGRTADFSNTIVIATSNVGTRILLEGLEQGRQFEDLKQEVLNELRRKFRPEFLNRFTGIVVYKPLDKKEVEQITRLLLRNLKSKLKEKEILVSFSDELITHLAQRGYDPMWGARELRRVIRDEVEEKIAKKLLKGEISAGQKLTLTPGLLS